MRFKPIGYAPDLDPATPGVIVDLVDMIPTTKGMAGAKSPLSAGISAASEALNSVAVVTLLSGNRRTLAGGQTKLFEAGSSSWTDRSAGGGYSIGTDQRWSFAQFGDVTLAAAKSETLQASTGSGVAFAAVSDAPKMKFIAVSDGFVMGVDINDAGGYGDQSDRWWCSAYLDYTDWTVAVSTQCTSGRLVDSPGPIRGIKTLGKGFAAYKDNAIYVANYVGAPLVWSWQRLPGDVGCSSHHVIVDLGNTHAFIGQDDFYLFDGTSVVPIGKNIREWFFSNLSIEYAYRTVGTYDPTNGNIWWWYVSRSNSTNNPDQAVVYNIRTGKWGKYSLTIEAVATYYGTGITYHGLGDTGASGYDTYEDLPTDISYDAPYWTAGVPDLAVVKTDHILYTMTGNSGDTSMTLHNIGDLNQWSTIRRVRPRFATVPSGGSSMEYSYDNLDGDGFTSKTTVTYDGKFDLLWSSRWHRCVLRFGGNVEIVEVDVDLAVDGSE